MAVNTRAGLSCAAAPPKSVPANAKANSTRFMERSPDLSNGRPYFDHSNVHGRANEHVVDTRTSTPYFRSVSFIGYAPRTDFFIIRALSQALNGRLPKDLPRPGLDRARDRRRKHRGRGLDRPRGLAPWLPCRARTRCVRRSSAPTAEASAARDGRFRGPSARPGRTGTGTPAPRGSAIAPAARSAAAAGRAPR